MEYTIVSKILWNTILGKNITCNIKSCGGVWSECNQTLVQIHCIVFKYNYKCYKIFKYKYNCNYFGQESN